MNVARYGYTDSILYAGRYLDMRCIYKTWLGSGSPSLPSARCWTAPPSIITSPPVALRSIRPRLRSKCSGIPLRTIKPWRRGCILRRLSIHQDRLSSRLLQPRCVVPIPSRSPAVTRRRRSEFWPSSCCIERRYSSQLGRSGCRSRSRRPQVT